MNCYCGDCGSTDVVWDAWAIWSDEKQEFVLGSMFDHCECSNCGSENIQEGGCETA